MRTIEPIKAIVCNMLPDSLKLTLFVWARDKCKLVLSVRQKKVFLFNAIFFRSILYRYLHTHKKNPLTKETVRKMKIFSHIFGTKLLNSNNNSNQHNNNGSHTVESYTDERK